jgi:hypothetical protein
LQAYLVGKRHRDKVSQGRQFPEQDWPSRLVSHPRPAPPTAEQAQARSKITREERETKAAEPALVCTARR